MVLNGSADCATKRGFLGRSLLMNGVFSCRLSSESPVPQGGNV
jgi:hypothetical protein